MRTLAGALIFLVVGIGSTSALAEEDYRVVDHLQISKSGDMQSAQPALASVDVRLRRDDIAAVQKCKDLGPAARDPDTEAVILNECLARNSFTNITVVSTPMVVKAVLR